jgi:hypothetical protein
MMAMMAFLVSSDGDDCNENNPLFLDWQIEGELSRQTALPDPTRTRGREYLAERAIYPKSDLRLPARKCQERDSESRHRSIVLKKRGAFDGGFEILSLFWLGSTPATS